MSYKPTPQAILHVLSDEKTAKIFRMAETGFEAGLEIPKNLSISFKQYYSRLNKLVKIGLIEKKDGKYTHTTLGMIVQNTQIKPLEEAIANYWNLLAVNELKKSETIPLDEQEKIIESLIKGTSLKNYLFAKPPKPFKVIKNYEELLAYGVEVIDSAKDEIYMASRYYDPLISQKIIEKFSKGVKINLLDGNPEETTLMNRLKSVISTNPDPKIRNLILSIVKSPRVRIRNTTLNFSFFVIDGIKCGFECPNILNSHDFYIALEFEDQDFSKKLTDMFEKLYESAKDPYLKEIFQKK